MAALRNGRKLWKTFLPFNGLGDAWERSLTYCDVEYAMRYGMLVFLMFCCLGCGKGDGNRAAVSGKVTLDGAPVATGSITFFPMGNTKGCTAGGDIRDGQYSISVAKGPVIGHNRVEIRATEKTGRKVQAPMSAKGVLTDESVQVIPDRYNSVSTLECDVEQGNNVLDFTLTRR